MTNVRRARRALAALLGAWVVAGALVVDEAAALTCPDVPLPDRYQAAAAAFVGEVVTERAPPVGEGRIYRFDVKQAAKGSLGTSVELRADAVLVDAQDRRLVTGEDVGVLATLDGATLTTSSCLLTDPAALLAVADEPRGFGIKLVLGLVLLAAVVGWSARRRRHGQPPRTLPRPPAAADTGPDRPGAAG